MASCAAAWRSNASTRREQPSRAAGPGWRRRRGWLFVLVFLSAHSGREERGAAGRLHWTGGQLRFQRRTVVPPGPCADTTTALGRAHGRFELHELVDAHARAAGHQLGELL